ncbi:MAG TPA: hypothetical protein VGI40_14380, partial [Pirellulaceae bacterium]
LLLAGAAALAVTPTVWISQHWLLGIGTIQLAACAFMWWLLAPLGWLGWLLLFVAALGLVPSPPPLVGERGSSLLRSTSG